MSRDPKVCLCGAPSLPEHDERCAACLDLLEIADTAIWKGLKRDGECMCHRRESPGPWCDSCYSFFRLWTYCMDMQLCMRCKRHTRSYGLCDPCTELAASK